MVDTYKHSKQLLDSTASGFFLATEPLPSTKGFCSTEFDMEKGFEYKTLEKEIIWTQQ
jgi:hypothetical protein